MKSRNLATLTQVIPPKFALQSVRSPNKCNGLSANNMASLKQNERRVTFLFVPLWRALAPPRRTAQRRRGVVALRWAQRFVDTSCTSDKE